MPEAVVVLARARKIEGLDKLARKLDSTKCRRMPSLLHRLGKYRLIVIPFAFAFLELWCDSHYLVEGYQIRQEPALDVRVRSSLDSAMFELLVETIVNFLLRLQQT